MGSGHVDVLDADPVAVAQQLWERAGAEGRGALGVAGGRLGDLARRAAGRPEFALTPGHGRTEDQGAVRDRVLRPDGTRVRASPGRGKAAASGRRRRPLPGGALQGQPR